MNDKLEEKKQEESNFKKKKDFVVTPTPVNYQISQVVAKDDVQSNKEEKERL